MIRKSVLSLSLILACMATFLTAQEETAPPKIPEFYLGVQCMPVPELLDSHLILEGQGVLIQTVVPNGPADKAGVKQGDILLSIAGKEVRAITDIFAILGEEQGKEQAILVMQKGKKNELKITPEKRPENPASFGGPSTGTMRTIQPGIIFNGKDSEDVRKMLRKFMEQMEESGVNPEIMDPNHLLDDQPNMRPFDGVFKGEPRNRMERFEVSVIQGDKPGSQRIHVRKNNEVWDVERIEDLPEELQERVRQMTGPIQEQEGTFGQFSNKATEAWKAFSDKTQQEYTELETELKKAYENSPGLQEKVEKYRKATEDYFKSFWNSTEEPQK